MADQEYVSWLEPSCPANTAAGSYQTLSVDLPLTWLHTFEVRIPPGHAGLTGIALIDGSAWLVPFSTSPAWLIGDDDLLSYPYEKELGKTPALAFYNTDDTYTHGWQVRLVYTPMSVHDTDQATITLNG